MPIGSLAPNPARSSSSSNLSLAAKTAAGLALVLYSNSKIRLPQALRMRPARLRSARVNPRSILLAVLISLLIPASLVLLAATAIAQPASQTQPSVTSRVVDPQGNPIPGAQVRSLTGALLGTTTGSGSLSLSCASGCPSPFTVMVTASGFAQQQAIWQPAAPVVLQLAQVDQSVTVTAYRTPLGDLESPTSTRMLSATELQQAAPITLDGQLRLIPGVETFRRSSSLVANPSSQGLSLRGLGSTSASRTLVTEDDVPLNDAFAGWIHWEELPELSIHGVEAVRGGASDLYGSSAIGGVVNVFQEHPSSNIAELKSDYGSENTYDTSLLFEGKHGPWGALLTGGTLGTDGFMITTPSQRGAIDINSNVHAQNGLALIDHQQGALRIFARTNGLNEARSNGTPIQVNKTRLWRYSLGSDWTTPGSGALTFRAYGSTQHYYQTFSTISAAAGCPTGVAPVPRNFECLNKWAQTPDNELGAVLHWSHPALTGLIGPGLLYLVGADTHDVRAEDYETAFKSGAVSSLTNLSDRQRLTGAYAELLYSRQAWTVSASGRIDWFSNFDGYQWLPAYKPLHRDAERPVDPRMGISRKLGSHFALSAMGFRAFRAPSPNELYRSTQVGSFLTLPNGSLSSERATGWETGVAMQQRWGTLRTSYFWTQVNHPITALTVSATSNPIRLMRENLGQIESRGVSLDYEVQPTGSWNWMTLQGGYQYTNATVTKGTGDAIAGLWIPQVAHQMATAQLRGYRPSIGTFSLQGKISGRQFDDDANKYLLHGYFKLDAYASHDFGSRFEVFASGENLLNRQIEVGRTPTLTLGTPRVARIGIQVKLTPGAR